MNKLVKPADQQAVPADIAVHEAWLRDQIEFALKAKREGRATYKPLREVAAKFGSNAG